MAAAAVERGDAADVDGALAPQRAADLARVAFAQERGGLHAVDSARAIHEALGVGLLRSALFEEAAGELDGRDGAARVERERPRTSASSFSEDSGAASKRNSFTGPGRAPAATSRAPSASAFGVVFE